jgi:hypothetical protein
MENRKKRITFATLRDRWIEGLIIFACVTIPVLDFFGLLDGIPIFNGKIANFTLFLLAILTGYVAFTQPERQETFHEQVSDGMSKIFERLDSSSAVILKVRPFTNISAGIEYARKQIEQAKQQVVVIYPDLYQDFYRAVPSGTFYKQIFTIDLDRLEDYRRVLPKGLHRMPKNYSFACLGIPKELLQCFVIIDDKELIIISDLLPITTRHPQFIKIYRQSFNDIWDKAIKLKTNDRIHEDKIQLVLMAPQRLPEIPIELEDCIRNCLKAHEEIKSVARQKSA